MTLAETFARRREASLDLIQGLDAEDMVVQSMEDASPAKWHLAHTTWFFEQFVLKRFDPEYTEFDPHFNFLFNSYYNSIGERHPRPERGMLSRPSLQRVLEYREAVNASVLERLDRGFAREHGVTGTITVGLHHEMQHQELLLTDILHALSLNPMAPAMVEQPSAIPTFSTGEQRFLPFDEGLFSIGATDKGFAFDCEGPRHQAFLRAFSLARRPVTNQEWLEFIEDGGYTEPTLWLSDGWARCQQEGWSAPLYWQQIDGDWVQFSHYGCQPVESDRAVSHISYFEADAFARWAGARLPTEQEWEVVARQHAIEGNFMENKHWLPQAAQASGIQQLYGDVWEWTASPYMAYPGFRPAPGAVGEYNGKFMSGQYVLRGGSCVTPIEQMRPSYRNFFYPHQRWQFTGLRLAKDS
jgi:ergothioneine biosynthesis protein EgtB